MSQQAYPSVDTEQQTYPVVPVTSTTDISPPVVLGGDYYEITEPAWYTLSGSDVELA